MPHRLSSLASIISVSMDGAPRPADSNTNDNLGGDGELFLDPLREPEWKGPGTILSLGVKDGRHGLGSVRAAVRGPAGCAEKDRAILLALLEHYGIWMGFEGRPEPVRTGEMRLLPAVVRGHASAEYRLDLRRIARAAQSLTADGTVLLDGRPAAALDSLSIVFRPSRSRVPSRARRRAERHHGLVIDRSA